MEKALLATARTDTNTPIVAKVTRSGILPEKVFLPYSQERFASCGLKPENLSNILNTTPAASWAHCSIICRRRLRARIDVRQLETGDAVGLPVVIRISGDGTETLLAAADRAKQIFSAVPIAARPRDDWGEERFDIRQETDPDRANAAGITNRDVASASTAAMNGVTVTVLRQGDKQIPPVARLRVPERAQHAHI